MRTRKTIRRPLVGSVVAGILAGSGSLVLAQNAAPAGDATFLEEVLVTATRRPTGAQETPLAITAIGGAALQNAGITNPEDLSGLAPNLHVDQGISAGQTHVAIRGIANTDFGIAANSPVATYIDDIYQPFQFGLATQLFDMNRVEVLRGPQGTLFGKNTTSGALNLYSQLPTRDLSGYLALEGGGGDFDHYAAEGAFNAPVSDTLAVRLSGRYDRRDAYIENLFNNSRLGKSESWNERAQALWHPGDDTTVNLKLYAVDYESDGPTYSSHYVIDPCTAFFSGQFGFFPSGYLCEAISGVPAPQSRDSRHVYSDVPTFENYDNQGAALKVEHRFGDYTLTALSGWQQGKIEFSTNDDGVGGDAFNTFQGSHAKQLSQEIRLATPVEAALKAVAGVFFQHDSVTTDQGAISSRNDSGTTPGMNNFGFDYYGGSLAHQVTDSYAAFGSVTYALSEQLEMIGGLRYSYEKKQLGLDFLALNGSSPTAFHSPPLNLVFGDNSYRVAYAKYFGIFDPATDISAHRDTQNHWDNVTWDYTLNYKPTSRALLYGRVASGFRSGAFQVGVNNINSFASNGVGPEDVMSYEVGWKSEWFGRTLRLNGAVFFMDYKDMQVQSVSATGLGSTLTNAGNSEIKGAELELEYAPIENFSMSASAGYTDAKFTDFQTSDPRAVGGNVNGNRLPYAPEWTASVGLKYAIAFQAFRLELGTDWRYRDKFFMTQFEEALASENADLVGDAQVTFAPNARNWRVTAYGKNLTNEEIKAFQFQFGGILAPAIYQPKRTWGLRLSVDFGAAGGK